MNVAVYWAQVYGGLLSPNDLLYGSVISCGKSKSIAFDTIILLFRYIYIYMYIQRVQLS